MTLCSSREVKKALKIYVLPELKNSKDYNEVKDILIDQSREVLIPEGTPESRTKDIKHLINEIDYKLDLSNSDDKQLLQSLKKEADNCLNLKVNYSNPNLKNKTASNNRCYAYGFKELLSVINEKPEAVFEDV